MVSLFHWIPCLHHQLVACTLMHHLISCSGIFLFQSIPYLRHPAIAPALPCISRFKSKLLSSFHLCHTLSHSASLKQYLFMALTSSDSCFYPLSMLAWTVLNPKCMEGQLCGLWVYHLLADTSRCRMQCPASEPVICEQLRA